MVSRSTVWFGLLALWLLAVSVPCRADDDASEPEVDQWGVLQLRKYLRASTEYLERFMKTQKNCGNQMATDELFEQVKLDVRDGRTFSFRDFFLNYASRKRPVLIKNYMARMFPSYNLTTQFVREKCGHKKVFVQRANPEARTWGGLDGGEDVRLRDFIDGTAHPSLYLHDWPLPRACPDLLNDYWVPKYFASDYIHRIPAEEQKHFSFARAWPSLFIGRKGTFSALHVDSFGSNFWMLLLEGKKHWRFFPNEDRPLLYENPDTQSFQLDAFNPDYEKYPLAAFARSFDVILEPGDLLFVPAGMPHQVRNPEYSVAMSANYVDSTNIDLVKEELGISAKSGYKGSEDLLNELSRDDFPTKIFLDSQKDMHFWREFNQQTFDEDGDRISVVDDE